MSLPTLATDRGVRTLVKVGLVLLAILALAWVMLLAALRFIVVPNIEGFRPRLTNFLQDSIGRSVEIGGLGADWEGWNPRFVLHELKVLDPQGNVALRLPKVEQTVSWRSVLSLQLTSRRLIIDGLRVVVRRDANNQISVAGLEMASNQPEVPSDPRIADWFLAQRSVSLRGAEVVWIDEYRTAPPIALRELNARLVNSGNRHRLGISASWSDRVASPVQFVADLNGETVAKLNEWSGRTYLKLDSVDIARTKQWIDLPFPVQSGIGGLQVWASIDQGRPNDITADVRLDNVRTLLPEAKAPLALARLEGRMQWTEARGRSTLTSLRAETLQGQFADKSTFGPFDATGLIRRGADGKFEKGEVSFEGVDLTQISKLLPALPIPENFGQTLQALALRGRIGKTRYEWEGEPTAPKTYSLSSAFERLTIAQTGSFPGVTNVSGTVKLNETGGQIELSGRDVELNFPNVFTSALRFDELRTGARWSTSDRGIDLRLDQTRLANADLSAVVSGQWSRGRTDTGAGTADFSGVIERAKADRVHLYLPVMIDKPVREYVRLAVLGGRVTRGDFVLRGPLAKFPFPNDLDGQWRITAQAEDVVMDYADHWPKLTDADLTLTFAGQRMTAESTGARMLGVPLGTVRASIPDLRVEFPQLSIIGTATAPTQAFLGFIDQSPVGAWIDGFTKGMQAEGEGTLSLAVEMSLGDKDARVAVRGDYEFRGNTLRLGGEIPPISDVRGKLTFTDRSTGSQGLQGRVFGGVASFVVQNVAGGIKVVANGHADVAMIAGAYPVANIERISGTSDWAMEVDTPSGGAFVLRSSLRGVKIDAPAPLGKNSEEIVPLLVKRTPLANKRDDVTVELGDRMRARVMLAQGPDGRRTVDGAVVALGSSTGALEVPTAQTLNVSFVQPEILLDPWIDALGAGWSPSASAGVPASTPPARSALSRTEVLLRANRIIARGITLSQASVTIRPQGKRWSVALQSKEADGQIEWTPAERGAGAVQAKLTKLVLADRTPTVQNAAGGAGIAPLAVTPKSALNWPSLDVVVNEFFLRGNPMGRLEIKAAPLDEHWRIESLVLTNADAQLRADGVWTRGEADPQTILTATLTIADTQKYFTRIGLGEGIQEAQGEIAGQLGWRGSPLDFDMRALNGEFTIELSQGRFTKAEPGIAKLLGVISLQSLARRLVFDLRDLFTDGFSFDKVTAVASMRNGVLTTDNLDIVGPTARVEIRGTVSLPNETQDLNVRVIPDVTTSMAIGAGVVTANPLVAAGTFLASKVLKDPIDRAFSLRLKVSGTWADPKIDRLERFGGDRNPGESAVPGGSG